MKIRENKGKNKFKEYLKWPAHTTAAEFWMALRIYYHVPSWGSQLQSFAVSSPSESACHPPSFTPVSKRVIRCGWWHLSGDGHQKLSEQIQSEPLQTRYFINFL
jgi:hypothetical protein